MVDRLLKNLNLKYEYDSDKDNLIEDFYVPVLSNSTEYYRMSGFFSSSSLAISANGIAEFIRNNGKMKLLCSANLSKEDFEIIEEINENPEDFIEKSFIRDFNNLEDEFIRNHVEALGWMLANDLLEIKIAIPKDINGMFHSKVGILKDEDDNFISFSGSDNETASGWLYNIEEFKVFKSWDGSEEKFAYSDLNKFNEYWEGNTLRTNVFDLPIALKNKLIDIAPQSKYELNIVKNCKPKFKLRDYQEEAVNSWFNHECRGLFEMATGTGKTFTALSCFKRLSDKENKLITVISCPQLHLIDQWVEDVEKFHNEDIIIAASTNSNWKYDLKSLKNDLYLGLVDNAVIMTSHDTLSSEFFLDIIKKFKSNILLIVDEVHAIGSSKRLSALEDIYDYRLGLSATPSRWFDDEGTQYISDFFGGVIFEFGLDRAMHEINPDTNETYLTPYEYHPIFVDLSDEEYDSYYDYTHKIAALLNNKNKSRNSESVSKYCIARQRILNNAEEKYNALNEILKKNEGIDKLIVYCSDKQLPNVQKILNKNDVFPQHKFTKDESARKSKKTGYSERDFILKNFEKGSYKALVAIKCLDEGVDVPSAENVIIMSSTSNPREYIQRRGRVLRRAPGKEKAVIYDILVFPDDDSSFSAKIFQKELIRYKEFAKNAINDYDCFTKLNKYYKRFV